MHSTKVRERVRESAIYFIKMREIERVIHVYIQLLITVNAKGTHTKVFM